jgi:competence protein ComEA
VHAPAGGTRRANGAASAPLSRARHSGDAPREAGIASAALALSALLMGLAWLTSRPAPPPAPWPCPHAVEHAAVDGHTVAVRCAAHPDSGPALRGPAVLLFGRAIDLNRADVRTLESLPGIGPGRARAIVLARARAPFVQLEDLARVSGIGPKTIESLRGWAAVEPTRAGKGPHRDAGGGPPPAKDLQSPAGGP